MAARRCSCCGKVAVVLLAAGKTSSHREPTVVCHRCDYVGGWPVTRKALGRHR